MLERFADELDDVVGLAEARMSREDLDDVFKTLQGDAFFGSMGTEASEKRGQDFRRQRFGGG